MVRGNFIYKRLGEKIVAERKKKGLSQEELALSCDVDRTYIARMEEGKANPSIKVLSKLSKKLGIRISSLLEGV